MTVDYDPRTVDRFLDVDGVRLRVRQGGSGRPLLMIMGIGAGVDMWGPVEPALHRAGIRTVAFDAPGMGLSTNYRVPRRLPGMVKTIEAMLDQLDYDEVDVLGVSFGGGLAQQLAYQLPDRVRRLVLCVTSAGMVSLPGRPRALAALATPRRYWDSDYYRKIAPQLFGGRSRRDPVAAADAQRRFAHPPSTRGYLQQLYAVAGWTSFGWLPRLRQPTLVIAGDDDPIVPVINGRLLAQRIPNARLHVVVGGGHLLLIEQLEVTTALIAPFLTAERTPNPT